MVQDGGHSSDHLEPPSGLESSPAAVHTVFRDGPPARVTGGFGEDSCFACHWDGTENDEVGSLQLTGMPEEYEPGRTYDLEILLAHPDLEVAGFQLAVRYPDGETQAGSLEVPHEEEPRVDVVTDRDVEFAQHRLDGIEPSAQGETRWKIRWTAPDEASEKVYLHISTVAGDGDDSQMGDAVYTGARQSRPPQ